MKVSIRRWLGVLAVASGLLVAACGTTADDSAGGDGGATTEGQATTVDPAPTEPEPTEPATTEPTEDPQGDDAEAVAESVEVTLADLPDGWDSAPHDESGSTDVWQTCAGIDLDEYTAAEHFSDDFTFGSVEGNDGQAIFVGTRVLADQADAEDIIATTADPEFVACVDDDFVATFEGATVEGDIEPTEVPFDAGDELAAYSGNLEIIDPASGESLEVTVAFIAIRTGNVVTGVSAVAVGQDPQDEALGGIIDRIAEAHASL